MTGSFYKVMYVNIDYMLLRLEMLQKIECLFYFIFLIEQNNNHIIAQDQDP